MTKTNFAKRLLACALAIAMVFSTAPAAFAGTAAAPVKAKTAVASDPDGSATDPDDSATNPDGTVVADLVIVNYDEPLEIYENTNGKWVTGENGNRYFEYSSKNLCTDYMVIIDGEEYECDGDGDIWYDSGWYYDTYDTHQNEDNPWLVGGTYPVDLHIMGNTATFYVTIVPSPVESVTINTDQPIKLIVNEKGWWDEGERGEIFLYYEDNLCTNYTVKINGRDYKSDSDGSFYYDDKWYYPSYETTQSYDDNWELGGVYDVTMTVLGKTVPLKVTIVESPASNLTINGDQPIELIEHMTGYWEWVETDEDESFKYFVYDVDDLWRDYSLTIDGKEYQSDSDGSFEYNDNWYYPQFTAIQTGEEPWVVGGTYDVTMNVMGVTTVVKVKIVKNPLEKILYDGKTTIEVPVGTKGYYDEDDDGNEYYRYDLWNILYGYTAILNGEPYEADEDGRIFYKGKRYYFDYDTEDYQSYETPWTGGTTHTVNVYLMDKAFPIEIKIVEPEVENVVINNNKTVEIIEGTKGYYDEKQKYYHYYDDAFLGNYTITIGEKSYTSDEEGRIEYNGEYVYPSIDSNQTAENPWVAGNTYYPSMTILGKTFTFPVKILETPVQSIKVNNGETLEIIENTKGYMMWDYDADKEYFYYAPGQLWESLSIMIDGKEYTVDFSGDIAYNDEYYTVNFTTNQSYDNAWTAGNTYPITVSVLGAEETFYVKIVETPVTSVTLNGKPVGDTVEVVENTHGSMVWYGSYLYEPYEILRDFSVTIDGKEYHSDEDGTIVYNGVSYRPDFEDGQDMYNIWTVGNTYDVQGYLMGKEFTIPINIVESPIQSVVLKPIVVKEHTNGETSWYWNEADEEFEYFWYDVESLVEIESATLKDGKKAEMQGSQAIIYNGEAYYPDVITDQDEVGGWGVGTHTFEAYVLGKLVEGKITIECAEHNWDKGTVTKAATCSATGTSVHKCLNDGCEKTETRVIPVNKNAHTWNSDYTVDSQASCKAEGTKSIHCKYCTAKDKVTSIPKKDHSYGSDYICDNCGDENEALKPVPAPQPTPQPTPTPQPNPTPTPDPDHQHSVKDTVVTKATATKNGKIENKCACGEVISTSVINKASKVKLSVSSYLYNGKKKTAPKVIVKDSKGKTISSKYYTVTKPKTALKAIGNYTYTVKFKGDKYTGTKKLILTIKPAKPTIKTPKAAKKAVTVKWKAVKKAHASGYQVMVATDKKFKKNTKSKFLKGYSKTSYKMTKLKSKKTYYARVRTYKTVKGVKVYSDWSKVKKIKTK